MKSHGKAKYAKVREILKPVASMSPSFPTADTASAMQTSGTRTGSSLRLGWWKMCRNSAFKTPVILRALLAFVFQEFERLTWRSRITAGSIGRTDFRRM